MPPRTKIEDFLQAVFGMRDLPLMDHEPEIGFTRLYRIKYLVEGDENGLKMAIRRMGNGEHFFLHLLIKL